MTSICGVELATTIIQDATIATPLLRLLYAFKTSHGDPLAEAMADDVLRHVWAKIPRCEEAMIEFILETEEEEITTQTPRAA